jgi:hypothetical protein
VKNKKSKNHPKKPAFGAMPTGQREGGAPASSPRGEDEHEGLITIREAAARIDQMAGKDGYWDVVEEVARTPIERFHSDARPQIELFLLRVALYSLSRGSQQMPVGFTKEQAAEAMGVLSEIAARTANFHLLPEFLFYLSATTYRVHLHVEALPHIAAAVKDASLSFQVFEYIRKILLMLRRRQHDFDDPMVEELKAIVDGYDLVGMLREAMALVKRDPRTTAQERALLTFFELDLEMRYGMHPNRSDRMEVIEQIRRLPSPTPAEYRSAMTDSHTPLTARSWAFLLDCNWMSETEEARELLARYPEELNHPLCDGIRAVLQSFFVDANKVDVYLANGLHLLMEFERRQYALGESILVRADDQWVDVPIAHVGLELPDTSGYLCSIGECKPMGYPRVSEVRDLQSTLSLILAFSNASEDDKQPYDGLPWLCEQSLAFHQAVAGVLRGKANRWRSFLESLTRCVREGVQHREFWYDPDSYADEQENITEAEALLVVEQLENLIEIYQQIVAENERLLNRSVGHIFQMLSAVDAVRPRVLELSRRYDPYLYFSGTSGLFVRGYLEQVAGSRKNALDYYLLLLAKSGAEDSTYYKNARLLWANSDDESEVEALAKSVQNAFPTAEGDQLKVLKNLHKDATASLQVLSSAMQFQRTAVNRWPKVSGPAMKVLSVLNQIKNFGSYAELAEYAGMRDVTWVRKHYERLVELGMVLDKGDTYDINPYILEHLEREDQHTVVGRIIRTQGTSAVKQVFNSNREFTIYQVMVQLCPNHLVFPNSSLQSIMSFDRMKQLVSEDDFGYYLRASVDIVVVSATTFLPLLAIEVDSVWHDTERQQRNDDKKDRLFATAGIPFMRLRPVGQPSQNVIRGQVAEHLDEMIRTVRADMPGYDQAITLLKDLSGSAG